MFFGLFNILVSFASYINKILDEKLNIYVIIYLENILIFTKNSGRTYVEIIYWVHDQRKKYGLIANLKK